MIKIYTPKEWYGIFKGKPALIIDDRGMIYTEEGYNAFLREAPVGKIDYGKGYIYGEDYDGFFPRPIGKIEVDGDVTKIYGEDYDAFLASPILYIKKDKVYSKDEFYSLFPDAMGVIERDKKGGGTGTPSRSSDKAAGGTGSSVTYSSEHSSHGDSSGFFGMTGGFIKWSIIFVAIIVILVLMTKFFFLDAVQSGSTEGKMSWISIGIGAAFAIIINLYGMIVDAGMAEKLTEYIGGSTIICLVVASIAGAILDAWEFFSGAVPWTGGDLVLFFLTPFVCAFIFLIPSIVVGIVIGIIFYLIGKVREMAEAVNRKKRMKNRTKK